MPAAPALGAMEMYGDAHVAALIGIAFVALVLTVAARRRRTAPGTEVLVTISGAALLLITLAWTTWGLLPGHFDIQQSLPLQLSDVLRYLTAFALLTRAAPLVAISFFWGLTLNLQSVLTPDVNYYQVVWLEYAAYWFLHGAVLIAPIVLVWGLGQRITGRGLAIAYATLLGWAGCAVVVNTLLGTNYGYLAHAPRGPSLLDVMGPWPQYLLIEAAVIAVVWTGMTLPFVLNRAARSAPSARPTRSRS